MLFGFNIKSREGGGHLLEYGCLLLYKRYKQLHWHGDRINLNQDKSTVFILSIKILIHVLMASSDNAVTAQPFYFP